MPKGFSKGMKFKFTAYQQTAIYIICGFDWKSNKPILANPVEAKHQVFSFKTEQVTDFINPNQEG